MLPPPVALLLWFGEVQVSLGFLPVGGCFFSALLLSPLSSYPFSTFSPFSPLSFSPSPSSPLPLSPSLLSPPLSLQLLPSLPPPFLPPLPLLPFFLVLGPLSFGDLLVCGFFFLLSFLGVRKPRFFRLLCLFECVPQVLGRLRSPVLSRFVPLLVCGSFFLLSFLGFRKPRFFRFHQGFQRGGHSRHSHLVCTFLRVF